MVKLYTYQRWVGFARMVHQIHVVMDSEVRRVLSVAPRRGLIGL